MGSIGRRELLKTLSGFSPFETARATPFPLASEPVRGPRPTLTLFPNGTIENPDGSLIDVSGSPTAGLQEAINGAMATKADLHVVGGSDTRPGYPGGAVVYRLLEPLILPPLQGRRISTGAVTWAFGFQERPGVFSRESGLIFDSCMMVDFDFNGQIVYFGAKSAVVFGPRTQLPLDKNITAIVASRIHFTTVVCYDPLATCTWFTANSPTDPVRGSITNNRFIFEEINGGAFGIDFQTPAIPRTIARNFISCSQVHAQAKTAVRVGDIPGHSGNQLLRQNSWELIVEPNVGTNGVETHGSNDLWDICVPSVFGSPGVGLFVGPQASNNLFLVKDIQGGIVDQSSSRTNRFV